MKLPFNKSDFKTKRALIEHIIKNEDTLMMHAKSLYKEADAYSFFDNINSIGDKQIAVKSNEYIAEPPSELNVLAVINTTNLLDSHGDVHIPGLWTKTLSENKRIKHIQEHKRGFDYIISSHDDLKAYAETISWKKLGYDLPGKTEALMFDSLVKQGRNSFMHEQYSKGYVDNHSVGMRYVKLIFCCDDQDFGANFEAWEKYFPYITNSEDAETQGYFWAVTEAKIIEGSAVVDGSNPLTPTLENNKSEPQKSTQSKRAANALDYDKLISLM